MEETVRKTVEKSFGDVIDENIQNEIRKNPNAWKNNPLFAISIITSAIGVAKEEYKKMIKENNVKFGISINEVDDFMDSLAAKIYKKYFH